MDSHDKFNKIISNHEIEDLLKGYITQIYLYIAARHPCGINPIHRITSSVKIGRWELHCWVRLEEEAKVWVIEYQKKLLNY